uniref:CID domain-containing protein n=4 Tax=Parascaris TaxID=6254 RepID=A0A915B7G7_PARUN
MIFLIAESTVFSDLKSSYRILLSRVMVRTAEEAVLEYREALNDLKDNNKMQINLMTILAEDYSSFSREIVHVIAQQVERVLPTQKLAVMYVMDSILKNVTGPGNYKEHIEKVVHRLFLHVFETGDEKTRLSLHKLRQTWTGIFQRSTLYKIDLAVHEIDPAWPIVTPLPSNAASATPRAPVPLMQTSEQTQQQQPSLRAASRVHVNPHFFQKSAPPSVADRRQLSTTVVEGRPMADPRLARLNENGRTAVTMESQATERLRDRTVQTKSASFSSLASVKQEPRERTADVDERRFPVASSSDEIARGHQRMRDANEAGGRSPSDMSMKRRIPKGIVDGVIEEKKPRATLLRTPPHESRGECIASTSVVVPRPTSDLGSHAFLNAPRPRSPAVTAVAAVDTNAALVTTSVGTVPATVQQMSAVVAALHTSVPQMPATLAAAQTAMGPMVVNPVAPLAGTPLIPSVSTTSAPYAATAGGVPVPVIPIVPYPGMPPVLAPRFMPPVPVTVPTTASAPVISAENTKLEGIPANNRIFVDGRAYEVSYINDIPVIERNSLPHRIYFTGAPRNVIIDGVAHLLNFGEEKRVMIDGEEHVLKFGAPSRELYMGNYPFKGAFGGPPIFATINGVRHEIRLGGPPPEVKIEPDPCYELLRHMPRQGLNSAGAPRTMNAPVAQQASSSKEQSMDVKGLLAKLQKSGILSTLTSKKEDKTQRDANRSPTPPIPSEHRGEVTERLPKPPTDLKKFSMRALKIRYDSVVESLHQTRHLCPNCGLRFTELKGERYERHLDWHFRENLKSTEGSRCRAWYLPVEEWLEFSEQEELSASTSASHAAGDSMDADDSCESSNVPLNVSCDAVSIKECGVCGERFEEYWDEEGDAWKLKECTLGADGRPFHPSCILDATMPSAMVAGEASEEEHTSDKALLNSTGRILKKELLTGQ